MRNGSTSFGAGEVRFWRKLFGNTIRLPVSDASARCNVIDIYRKVDVRLPGKGNSNSHGARLVHPIITMIEWIRTSRLSIKNSLWRFPVHPRS